MDSCDHFQDEICYKMNCVCGREITREWLNDNITNLSKKHSFHPITIYLQRDIIPFGTLCSVDIKSVKAKLSKEIRSLRIPGLRCILHLDIQQTDYIRQRTYRESDWHIHWHGAACADAMSPTSRKKIYKFFNHGIDSHACQIAELPEKNFDFSYPVKFLHDHKRRLRDGVHGQIERKHEIKGRYKKELEAFYTQWDIEDCLLLIGFRRNRCCIIPANGKIYQNHNSA